MPKSRGRAGRRTHDKIRARRRAQVTDDPSVVIAQSFAAFDRADPRLALRKLRSVPDLADSTWAAGLDALVEAGPGAPTWLWCRAVLAQAYRSAWVDEMDTVRVAAASVVVATYAHEGADDAVKTEMMRQAMAIDELVRDVVLYDGGLLSRYLRTRASAALLARVPMIGEWTGARRSVFELGALEHDTLVVTDLVTGQGHAVLHLGAAAGRRPSERVLGRLAPIAEEPGQIFVSRPQHVDDVTAHLLVRDWSEQAPSGAVRDPFPALAEAVAAGRMPSAPGLGAASLSVVSDPPPLLLDVAGDDIVSGAEEHDAPRVQELVESGLSLMDAHHVVVVEAALVAARRSPHRLLPVVATHAAVALSSPRVRDVVRARRVAAEAPYWRMIARCVQEPVRRFCLEMAEIDAA